MGEVHTDPLAHYPHDLVRAPLLYSGHATDAGVTRSSDIAAWCGS